MIVAALSPKSANYDAHRRDMAERRAQQSAAGRDIGPTPAIADPKRRKRCERNLALFARTYNPATFYWPWSPDLREVIETIEQSIFSGGMTAIALPRGGGKSSICRTAVLWAVSYGLVAYPFIIAANAEKASESLGALKIWMRTLEPYDVDFPEITRAARYVRGQANRAQGTLCNGQETFFRWEADRIVLPRVPPPPNGETDGPWARTSGIVIGTSGLTGEGIRGSLFAHPDGRSVRPDFVLLDDPQTDESARSVLQNAERLSLITGAVLGMAPPGKQMAAVMPLTVIQPGDMADKVLDRKENPLWRGIRRKLLTTMPTNMADWQEYFEVYNSGMGQTKQDIKPANRYYRTHRAQLDAGASASWRFRKGANEVSAIQHAMNLYCRLKPARFMAEFQNEPLVPDEAADLLTPLGVAAQFNRLPRGMVATKAQYVTGFIDVHDEILYWTVSAWEPDFTGGPVDYGVYPSQPVPYFVHSWVRRKLADVHPSAGKEGAIQAGLDVLVGQLLSREWMREDGAAMKVGRLLVDCAYDRDLVCAFCRRSPHSGIVMPTRGYPVPRGQEWSGHFLGKEGGQTGFHWRIPPPKGGGRYVLTDVNFWKSLAWERFRVAVGNPGAWSLFGDDPKAHAMLADHYCGERPVWVVAKGMGRWEWEVKEKRNDVHWWDCLVGTAAAAAMLGVMIPGVEVKRKRRKVSLAELMGGKR